MKNLGYWLDKIGISGILLSPAEAATKLAVEGKYTGFEQIDEVPIGLTAGLAAWNGAKYIEERKKHKERSPLVHLGRGLQVAGAASTAALLQTGAVDNVYRAFLPAALGVTVGPTLEYVAGPLHERYSGKYRTDKKSKNDFYAHTKN